MKGYAEFKIFGEVWLAYLAEYQSDEFCGKASFDTHTITISDKINPKSVLFTETMCHEFLHALFRRLSYYQVIPHELEEVMNDQISKAIAENFHLTPIKRARVKK